MAVKSITLRNYRSFGPEGVHLPLDTEFVGIVGANNSGKSSLLKALYEMRPVLNLLASLPPNSSDLQLAFSAVLGAVPLTLQIGERVTPAWDENAETRVTIHLHSPVDHIFYTIDQLTIVLLPHGGGIRLEVVLEDDRRIGQFDTVMLHSSDGRTGLYGIKNGTTYPFDWESVRIDLGKLANSLYIGPFRNAINSGGSSYYDLQIGRDFISQFEEYKSGSSYSANQSIAEMTQGIASIFGFSRLEINPSPDGSHFSFLIDGRSFRSSELGAGIAQFVLVAASVLVRKPSILLIDEPELNLHASLQLKFLTLLADSVNGPVVFASHSLGLTRSAADLVLVATRTDDGRSRITDLQVQSNLSLVLGELGYGGLHDATYAGVLLVEGVTEVRVMQELLSKIGVRNQLAIVQLGGDGMASGERDVELSELRKLSPNVFAIVDSERLTPEAPIAPRRQAFRESCEALGINVHVLERRATENYLDHGIASNVMGLESNGSMGLFDSPSAGWSKAKNWRVARAMEWDSIADTDLGRFLESISRKILPDSTAL